MNDWPESGLEPTPVRKFMTNLSLIVREKQYRIFDTLLHPNASTTILDVGTTYDTLLQDSNFFEYKYPWRENLHIASVEDCHELAISLGLKKFTKIFPDSPLPFDNDSFDIVVSWATLEHVGTRSQQTFFLKELSRVGKRCFITTPDKASIYEPHTSTLFLHWLRQDKFRSIIKKLGYNFWSQEKNLNIMSYHDSEKIITNNSLEMKILQQHLLKYLPSHLIIIKTT